MSTVLVLVNDDGHIAMVASGERQRTEVAAIALLLAELRIGGWTAAETGDPKKLAAGLAGYHHCRVCTMCLGCGCPVQLAAHGGCPHGGGGLIDAAGRRLGLTR